MSEEFLEVAIDEINQELDGIRKVLATCQNDSDIFIKAEDIERHLHKIKGLAPMMGRKEVGKIAEIADTLLKQIIQEKNNDGIFVALSESYEFMAKSMNGKDCNFTELKQKIEGSFSEILS